MAYACMHFRLLIALVFIVKLGFVLIDWHRKNMGMHKSTRAHNSVCDAKRTAQINAVTVQSRSVNIFFYSISSYGVQRTF